MQAGPVRSGVLLSLVGRYAVARLDASLDNDGATRPLITFPRLLERVSNGVGNSGTSVTASRWGLRETETLAGRPHRHGVTVRDRAVVTVVAIITGILNRWRTSPSSGT